MGQIGTIRVDTQNNGTVSVPVFDTGDSGSSIYEFVRVQTANGTGFIPVEDTGSATYPFLRVRSQSHGTVAMTDRSTAIPDSEDLQARYDWRNNSGTSTVTDETANGFDLTGTYSGVIGLIEGIDAGLFDGTDDLLDVAFTELSQPTTISCLIKLEDATSEFKHVYDSESGDNTHTLLKNDFGGWKADASRASQSTPIGGSLSTNPTILTVLFNGSNSVLRQDGTQIGSGDIGANGLNGITMGGRADGVNKANFSILEWLGYDGDKSSKFSNIESYLDRDTTIL